MTLKVLVVCKNQEGGEEAKTCKIIKQEGVEVSYAWKNTLTSAELKNADIIVAIGGDGTVLSAAHYIMDKPLLAVNSSPDRSVGALTSITLSELAEKLEEIKKGKYREEKLERMEVFINGKKLDVLALNDVFLGSEKPYHPSKYEIVFNGKKEKQISSGLIFSTGTGSTAWFHSARGKPFSPQEKFIKMIVREPYKSKFYHPTILDLKIQEKEEIEIVSLTDSILAVDSIREFALKTGDKVKIKISLHPLRRII